METAVTVPERDGAQEVGVVVDTDYVAAAVLVEPDRARDAGQAFDDRAVHTAVHDAPRLQQLVVDLQLRFSAVRSRARCTRGPIRHRIRHRGLAARCEVTQICLHVADRPRQVGPRVIVGHGQDIEGTRGSCQRRRASHHAGAGAGMIAKRGENGVLVVDVRDAPEVQQTGKVAGAVHVPRGMLEFRADTESAYHDKGFAKDKPVICTARPAAGRRWPVRLSRKWVTPRSTTWAGSSDWAESGGAIDKPYRKALTTDGPRTSRCGARPSHGPGVSAALRTPARSGGSFSIAQHRQGCPNLSKTFPPQPYGRLRVPAGRSRAAHRAQPGCDACW